MILRRSSAFTALSLFSLLTCSALFGQDATGRVLGTVSDPSGGSVAGATITVTNVATKVARTTLSAPDGSFQVLLVPIGQYMVAVDAKGFRKSVTSSQSLEINQALRVDVRLEVGSTSETVQVEANVSGVETVSAALGGVVTASQITNMPLNGRNTLDLVFIQPGVIPASTGGANGFSIGGGRTDSVTFLLDGGVNNNLLNNGVVLNPNPDTVEEFKVITNSYNAEYGRGGGGVVSVVTKSGTNSLHGSLFEFVRNTNFNANTFFNNANRLPIDQLKRNQFGFAVGGPMFIPKVLDGRNKLFFFLSYQKQIQRQTTSTAQIQVYTPAELNGDFSKSNAGKNGPDAGVASFLQQNPFFQPNAGLAAQGIIDPTRFNSVAKNYLKNNLVGSSPSGSLISQGSATSDPYEYTGKVDYVPTARDRISVTLGVNFNSAINPFAGANVIGYPNSTDTNRKFGAVNYTKIITPSLLNDFRFTVQRNDNFQAVPAANLPKPADLGIGITSDHPTGPPNLSFASGMTTGFSVQGPTQLIDNTYTWSDVMTWNRGKHSIKGGFSYTPYQNNTVYDFYINGTFFFSGAAGNGGIGSGNDRADFLLGLPDEFQQFPEAPSNIRSHNVGFFVQDEWKVRRNLTLTFGLRYEYSSPKIDTQGRSFSLLRGAQSTVFTGAPKGLLFPGDKGAPVGANFPDRNDWAPRFGFAWDPKGDGKTSIRGGFGVFHDILKAEDNLQFNGQAPFFGFADLFYDPLSKNPTKETNYFTNPFVATGQPNPFPSRKPPSNLNFDDAGFLPVGGGGVYFVDPNLRTPYVYQYNLSLQRELARNYTLLVAYAGSSSHKLTSLVDANPFILGTTNRLFNATPGNTSGSFSYLDEFTNAGYAKYNSLQTGLTKRFADSKVGATSFQLSYTYGRSMDNESGFRSRNSRVAYYNANQFYAPSDYDLKSFISFSGGWTLPFDKLWTSGPKRLLGGWNLYPIFTYRTGQPLDVTSQISRSRTRTGPSAAGDPSIVRANLINPAFAFYDPKTVQKAGNNRTGNFYFDPTAFSTAAYSAAGFNPVANPSQRTYGSLQRNAFRGPDRTNLDISMSKSLAVYKETVKVELRGDFFNVLNHAEFGNPNTTITSSQFGQISTTAAPRIIQIALRLTF